jgi:hypothetical protein
MKDEMHKPKRSMGCNHNNQLHGVPKDMILSKLNHQKESIFCETYDLKRRKMVAEVIENSNELKKVTDKLLNSVEPIILQLKSNNGAVIYRSSTIK